MENLTKNCTTCKFYRPSEFKRSLDKCSNSKIESSYSVSEYTWIDLTDKCGPKRDYFYWEPMKKYTLQHKIQQCPGNSLHEDDYFEIFEHISNKITYVWVGICRREPVNKKYYYIKKNGEYYECSDSRVTGFVSLEDPFSCEYLNAYDTLDEAISSVERYKRMSDQDTSLVYSTRDTLETKFNELEKVNAKG